MFRAVFSEVEFRHFRFLWEFRCYVSISVVVCSLTCSYSKETKITEINVSKNHTFFSEFHYSSILDCFLKRWKCSQLFVDRE